MNQPSEEQQLVIDNLKNGYNVVCSAVAGSGKSSTVLSTSKQMPDRQILQITYNSSLRLEIKEKVTHF
jgi:adenylate kinase